MKRRFFNKLLAAIPFFATGFFTRSVQADKLDVINDNLIKVPNHNQIYYNPKHLLFIETDGKTIFFNPKYISFIDANTNTNNETTIHFSNSSDIVVKENIESVVQRIQKHLNFN